MEKKSELSKIFDERQFQNPSPMTDKMNSTRMVNQLGADTKEKVADLSKKLENQRKERNDINTAPVLQKEKQRQEDVETYHKASQPGKAFVKESETRTFRR